MGLQAGSYCCCGDTYGKHSQVDEAECNLNCPGNTAQKCGAGSRNSLYRLSGTEAVDINTDLRAKSMYLNRYGECHFVFLSSPWWSFNVVQAWIM